VSPEQFLQITDPMPAALFLLCPDGSILAANRLAAKRLGKPAPALRGLPISELVQDSRERVEAFIASSLRTTEPIPGSLTLLDAEGSPVVCGALGVRLQPAEGEEQSPCVMLRLVPRTESPTQFKILTERIDALNREIAHRRQAEAQLREQREWLSVTLSSIGDGVIATDAQGLVLFLNPTAERLTGWRQEEARGRPLEEVFRIVNEQTREPVEHPVVRVLAEGVVVGLANDTVLLSKTGQEWPIADSGAPIRDESGNVLGVVMVFLEISDRREAESQLRRQAEELREADRRKDRYIAMLAHELRNPLNAIGNALAILERAQPETPPFNRALEVARRQLRQQSRMVEDLLDVSRITFGTLQRRQEPIDLVAVCQETLDDFRTQAVQAGLEVAARLPTEPFWVEGDGPRLSQVLGNLLANSVKFTPDGGRVALELRQEGSEALLVVSDTGPGIPPEILPQVFEPFVQAEQSLARTSGGLGLGLALVRGLVELHGGTVTADVPAEGGTAIQVRLPLHGAEPEEPAELAPGVCGEPLRVLVIEDLADAAMTLKDLLEIWGHEVEVAENGASGIAAAGRFRPHVVLCDLGLPDIDGYTVAERLKADPATAQLPLVALTGYGTAEDRRRSAAAGFMEHLVKPVAFEDLRQLLARHCPAG
jgi:PAS domain S-box-containing protein